MKQAVVLGMLILACAGCARESENGSELTLASTAFADGGSIPTRFTCDGSDISPPLAWTGAPWSAKSFALVLEDPDAPGGSHLHWMLYDLPATLQSLPESTTIMHYEGPCPPAGRAHHYHFRLFALDTVLGLPPAATRTQLTAAMNRHELAQAELVGTYLRRK